MTLSELQSIVAEQVSRRFVRRDGVEQLVLSDVSLEISRGELVCLLGSSGCGKSTLINILAGFDRPSEGSVRINGAAVTGPRPERPVLFQDSGLFPWRTALDNVQFGLQSRGMCRKEAQPIARDYLNLVGLGAHERAYPSQLSGGMRQRVALARALAVEPEMLFMDEPFGALDTFTRYRMQDELLRILEHRRMTVVLVTHDLDEAVYLARRVILLAANPGRVAAELDLSAIPRACDRASPAFADARAEVFRAFANLKENGVHDQHRPAKAPPEAPGAAPQSSRPGPCGRRVESPAAADAPAR